MKIDYLTGSNKILTIFASSTSQLMFIKILKRTIIYLSFFLSANISAQSSGGITACIVDSISGEYIEFATVGLYNSDTEDPILGTITDANGIFILNNIPPGIYDLKCLHISLSPIQISDIIVQNKTVNLGIIKMSVKSTKLSEVEITADNPHFVNTLGKKVLNVDKDLSSQGGTVVDLLENFPSISIDIDNGVELRGAKPTILIDGVQTDLADFLDQIPANAIESIEVMTNPSVKYEAKDGAGVINIKMKRQNKKGVTGRASFGLDQKFNTDAAFNISYMYKGISTYVNYSNKYSTTTSKNIVNKKVLKDPPYIIDQVDCGEKNSLSQNIRLGGNIKLKKSLFSLGLIIQNSPIEDFSEYINNKTDIEGSALNFTNLFKEDNYIRNLYRLNLKSNIDLKDENQNLEFIILSSKSDLFRDYKKDLFSFLPDSTEYRNPKFDLTKTDDIVKTHSIQGDYTRSLGPKLNFEAGFKSQIRDVNLISDFFDGGETEGHWVLDSIKSNEFQFNDFQQDVYAVFNGKIGNVLWTAGTRLEYVISNSITPGLDHEDYSQEYIDFIPGVQIGRELSEKQEIQFSYSLRTNLPSYKRLNPYVVSSNPYYLRYGNPFLIPERIHSFELEHILKYNSHNFSSSIFFRKTNEIIGRVIEIDNEGVTHSTSRNISDGMYLGMEFNSSIKLSEKLKLKPGITGFQSSINHNNLISQSNRKKKSWHSKIVLDYNIFNNIRIQLDGSYHSPIIIWDGQKYEYYYANLGIQASVLKKRGNINITITDIFDTYSSEKLTTNQNDFTTYSNTYLDRQRVMLIFVYKFYKRSQKKGKSK